LITCCADETRRKYGEGRRPTMRNIESRARMWLNMGITTHAQAESYLQEQQERGTRLAQISRLLHIGGRALSVTENRYISSWQIFSDELILKAYDITVVKTGSLKWKYMDTILKNWQSKGFTTPEDVEKKDTPRATPSTGKYEQDSMEKLREINRKRGTS
ncbi:MAG: DnaD domain protein, partial [Oscillospiraceae bacterium]